MQVASVNCLSDHVHQKATDATHERLRVSAITTAVIPKTTPAIYKEHDIFMQNDPDPCPLRFYSKFQYRKKSAAQRDYQLRLNDALRKYPESETLLRVKRNWDEGEYNDDWQKHEDMKANRKADVSFVFVFAVFCKEQKIDNIFLIAQSKKKEAPSPRCLSF
jgi:hypothetical protein